MVPSSEGNKGWVRPIQILFEAVSSRRFVGRDACRLGIPPLPLGRPARPPARRTPAAIAQPHRPAGKERISTAKITVAATCTPRGCEDGDYGKRTEPLAVFEHLEEALRIRLDYADARNVLTRLQARQ